MLHDKLGQGDYRCRSGRRHGAGCRNEGEPHLKFGALSRPFAVDLDVSAVQFRQLSRQRQPYSQTAFGTIRQIIGLVKQIKDLIQTVFGDARPVIAYSGNTPFAVFSIITFISLPGSLKLTAL